MGSVNDNIFANVPNEDGEFTAAGIDALLASAKKSLSADLRRTVVQLAGELSASDGAEAHEIALLEKIRKALA